jgi:hypothetical protein
MLLSQKAQERLEEVKINGNFGSKELEKVESLRQFVNVQDMEAFNELISVAREAEKIKNKALTISFFVQSRSKSSLYYDAALEPISSEEEKSFKQEFDELTKKVETLMLDSMSKHKDLLARLQQIGRDNGILK